VLVFHLEDIHWIIGSGEIWFYFEFCNYEEDF